MKRCGWVVVVADWAIGEQKVGRGNLSNVTFSLNTPPHNQGPGETFSESCPRLCRTPRGSPRLYSCFGKSPRPIPVLFWRCAGIIVKSIVDTGSAGKLRKYSLANILVHRSLVETNSKSAYELDSKGFLSPGHVNPSHVDRDHIELAQAEWRHQRRVSQSVRQKT
jgi:hypothetical protein